MSEYVCTQSCPESDGIPCRTCDPSIAFEYYVDGCPIGNIPIWQEDSSHE